MATLAEIGGRVSIEESHRGSLANIAITDQESGETRSYALPHTGLNIHDGDMIAKGTALNQGALNPMIFCVSAVFPRCRTIDSGSFESVPPAGAWTSTINISK